MGKIVKMSSEGQNLHKLSNGLNVYDLTLTAGVILTDVLGLYTYYHSSQTSLLVAAPVAEWLRALIFHYRP